MEASQRRQHLAEEPRRGRHSWHKEGQVTCCSLEGGRNLGSLHSVNSGEEGVAERAERPEGLGHEQTCLLPELYSESNGN